MNLSVSNIAWSAEEDESVYSLLRELGVSRLEIAPTRLWSSPAELSESEACAWRESMQEKGLRIGSFQALLFGQPGLALFGSESSRTDCLEYLKKIIRLASWLGAGPLVFGSPKNRLKAEMSMSQAMDLATVFFRELGDYAAERSCCLVIEANPAAYGCDFIQNLDEALTLVNRTDSPGFGLHLDAGELQMNVEDVAGFIARHPERIAHVHISEPMLAPVAVAHETHRILFAGLRSAGYNGDVTIEMKRQEPVLDTVAKAVKLVHSLS